MGLVLLPPAQAAILNGSFEAPVTPANDKSSTIPEHWVGNSAAGTINGSIHSFPVAEDGVQFAAIGNNGVAIGQISQGFSTTIADAYSLNWYDSAGYDGPDPVFSAPYSVSLLDGIGGVVLTQNFDAYPSQVGVWTERLLDVTLGAGDYTLVFTSLQQPFGHAAMLDNVSLLPSSIPEPATTTAVLALVAGGFFMLRRRSVRL